MTKFGDKTVLHVHVQVTSSFSQPLYYLGLKKPLDGLSMKDFDIQIGSWEQAAQKRSKWRSLIKKERLDVKRESVKLKSSAKNVKPRPI